MLTPYLAEALTQVSQTVEPNILGEIISKGVYLLAAAVLGFTFNVLLDIYKKRSEEVRRLSYTIKYREATKVIKVYEDEDKEVESKISQAYFYLENSGDKVLKEQFVRLMSSQGTEITSVGFEPRPEREIDLTKSSIELNKNEIAYDIGYIKPKQAIGINVTIESKSNIPMGLETFHKSNTEDVAFEPQEEIKIRKDRDVVQKFIALCLFFWIVPIPFEIPIRIGAESGLYFAKGSLELEFTIASLMRMSILLLLIREIEPFARVVTNFLDKRIIKYDIE